MAIKAGKIVKRILIPFLLAALLLSLMGIIPANPALAAATTSLTITKYAQDGTTVLAKTTIDYQTMETSLPVQGDGVTHQYLQGPVFEGDVWDPDETTNIKDWGANKGTDLKDICDLVGGMSPGDTVAVKASDGLSRTYDYPNVYNPDPRQGKMVICWCYNGQYVPSWPDGMRLVFFAETPNADGICVFGNWDQHECFQPDRWYFYNGEYPTTTGHSVKYINRINIYSSLPAGHNLTISVSGSGTTTPSTGVHSYPHGTVVDISATPTSSWQFSNWTGNVADPESQSTTVFMDADESVTANFVQYFTLTMSVDGDGTTTPAPGEHSFAPDTVVDIVARPASGWEFSHWAGAAADRYSAITTVTMNGDKSLMAYFVRSERNYKLTVSITGSGTTVPSAGEHFYAEGTVISINAAPSEGWRFSGWTGDAADPNAQTTTVTMDDDKTIAANFIESTGSVVFHTLVIEADGQGIITPSAGVYSYAHGTSVVVTATPDSGWQFDGWTGVAADPLRETAAVIIDRDMKITARFVQATDKAVPPVAAPPANVGGSTGDKPQDIEGRPASLGNSDIYPPEPAKHQETPWYVFLAIAAACAAAVVMLAVITVGIRNSRR
jgi:uncharacterized repeat protein (TIGR02543 family)